MNDDWSMIRARRVLGKLSDGAAMSETRWHREEWSCGCKETWNIDRREGGSWRCGKGAACVRDWEVRERAEAMKVI